MWGGGEGGTKLYSCVGINSFKIHGMGHFMINFKKHFLLCTRIDTFVEVSYSESVLSAN